MGEAEGPNMTIRDPNNLNDGLKVDFEDVIGEPDASHSIDCAWNCAYKCYQGGRMCCYHCLTVLCSWAAGLCWGCTFACITCSHVYGLTPCLRAYSICLTTCTRFQELMLNCTVAPLCAAYGHCFSNIKVTQG